MHEFRAGCKRIGERPGHKIILNYMLTCRDFVLKVKALPGIEIYYKQFVKFAGREILFKQTLVNKLLVSSVPYQPGDLSIKRLTICQL